MCNASLARPFQRNIYYYNTREEIFKNYYNFEDYFKNIDEQSFTSFIESSLTPLESNFLDALHTWTGDISKFAEIVEYYESVSSNEKYKHFRNCFSHTNTYDADVNFIKINFPNQFEFIGKSLDRKSPKNRKSLEVLVENILCDLKSIFPDKYNFKK